MRILEDIAKGYRKLFNETGLPKFFMYAKSIEKLNNNIMGVDKEQDLEQDVIAEI